MNDCQNFFLEFEIPLVLSGMYLLHYNDFRFPLFQCGNVGFGQADDIAKQTTTLTDEKQKQKKLR